MAFTSITKKNVGEQPNKPFLDAIIDNLNDLNARLAPVSRAQLIDNPSFEIDADADGDPDKWLFNDFVGGSHALNILSSIDINGKTSLNFISTVLANGGGFADTEDFIETSGSSEYGWRIYRRADIINVSSRAQIRWFTDAQVFISASTLFTDTSTPTTMQVISGTVTAPATARYAKFRIEGGVPGTGTATGQINFDAVTFLENPTDNFILQRHLNDSAVGQAELKTTNGEVSSSAFGVVLLTLPGGAFGLYPRHRANATPGHVIDIQMIDTQTDANMGTSLLTRVCIRKDTAATSTIFVNQEHIQASPPYDLGDGEVQNFIYLLMNGSVIESAYASTEAPWHYNGPTNIAAKFIRAGKPYRKMTRIERETIVNDVDVMSMLSNTATRKAAELIIDDTKEYEVEITQKIKNKDMPLVPHPFLGNDLTGKQVVMLDPISAITQRLAKMADAGYSLLEIIDNGKFIINNKELGRAKPPSVMSVAYRWKP